MSDNWLETSDLCRYYRRGPQEVRAVDGVSLELAKGEFLGVVGASGSGKSTLLNLLAGLDTPTSGLIKVGGVALSAMSRCELSAYRAHRVGMVFQSFNLLSHQTALENVALALYFNDTPSRDRRLRAASTLEQVGLGNRMDHRPADLSGGEQQRVAFARALVKRPEVLFADEPTGNLDHVTTDQVAELLTRLNREGLTVVMVSHDIALTGKCASRVLRMDYGRLHDDEGRPTAHEVDR